MHSSSAFSAQVSRLVVLVLFAFVVWSPCAAQTAPSIWDAPAFTADPQQLLKAAAEIAPDKYPHATILFDETHITIDDQLRVTQMKRMIYRIDSPKALEGWDQTSVFWSPWYQQRPEIKARVITVEGKVFTLDESTLSDSPARRESDNVYTDTRYYGGPLPGVAVGAIIEEVSVVRDTAPLFSAGSVRRFMFGSSAPLAKLRMVIDYPQTVPLRTRFVNLPLLSQKKEESNGHVTLTLENGRIDALPQRPDLLPPDVFTRGMIEFSTANSWKDVNQAYFKAVSEKLRGASVAEIVKSTVRAKDSRELKIARIVDKLHREVRYTGIEFGEASLIPVTPDETLKRHFGDCKDKSTLLVAMLQAAGIPASIALVRSTGADVDADHPGMGLFDHAIVYVPGKQDLWIDATAEYNVVGNVPSDLYNKSALVVDGVSGQLKRIPEPPSSANMVSEIREFYLQPFGPARVVETSVATGFLDARYRSYFGGPVTKDRDEALKKYGNNVYAAESASNPNVPDSHDLLSPFPVEIEFKSARRGFTDVDDAAVAIRSDGLFGNMPQWFSTAPDEKKTETDEPPRTHDYAFVAIQTEWRYRIHLPTGFSAATLPADSERKLGVATLSQHWVVKPNGIVEGTIRFDSVKGRYTVQEAQATRDAIVAVLNEPVPIIRFDNVGSSLIRAGKIKEGLLEYEACIKSEPKQALHRVRISRALLEAGLGEQARKEAETAVKLDDKSVQAWTNLGWAREHDLLGRRLTKGFDPAGALAAYKHAMELDPKDYGALESAAIISEFPASAERYGQGANLDEAIRYYDALKPIDKAQYDRFELNKLICLFYSLKFDAVLSQIGNRASAETFRSLAIAALASSRGSDAAVQESSRLAGSQKERSVALQNAARMLIHLREYAKASELLAAALPGAENSSRLQAQVELFRNTKRSEEVEPPATSPANAAYRFFVALADGRSNRDVEKYLTKHWEKVGNDRVRDARLAAMRKIVVEEVVGTGYPTATNVDIVLSNTKFTVEGDDVTGYQVWVTLPDSEARLVLVDRENNEFRVLGFSYFDTLGWKVREMLASGHEKEAAKLLDWARDRYERRAGDDPIAGFAFVEVWNRKSADTADRTRIEFAALALDSWDKSLVAEAKRIAESVPESSRPMADRLLFNAYMAAKMWKEAGEVAERLFRQFPHSPMAFNMNIMVMSAQGRPADVEKFARAYLASEPDDETAISALTSGLVQQDKIAELKDFIRARMKTGRATASELNSYAWNALFNGTADDESLEIARRSSAQTNHSDYSILHTLACINAEHGRTAEAREVMLQAMKAQDLEELDSNLWYVYGRIAEQYGQLEAARAAYARVEKPEDEFNDRGSTHKLASMRAAKLTAADAGLK